MDFDHHHHVNFLSLFRSAMLLLYSKVVPVWVRLFYSLKILVWYLLYTSSIFLFIIFGIPLLPHNTHSKHWSFKPLQTITYKLFSSLCFFWHDGVSHDHMKFCVIFSYGVFVLVISICLVSVSENVGNWCTN